jgi:predicted ferric reductase
LCISLAGYLPKRALSLFIAAYVILNIIFSAVSFHHVTPSVWYADRRHEIAAYVSNRTGVLSFANLALAILFSGRNNLLINITGWSQSTMLAIHRWASRIATVQAVVHSILYTLTYYWTGGYTAYRTEAAMAYYWWGIIATVVLCLSVIFAVLPIRVRFYEIFLITHIAFAILALIGCWYHIDLRFGDQWGYKVWLYIAFAFWAFDRLMRFVRLVYFNCFGSPVAVVKQIPHTDVIQMTITLKRAWNVKPGQHSFFYIPLLGKPWENHPFTIASWTLPESSHNKPAITKTPCGKEAEVHGLEINSSSSSQHSRESHQPNQLICLMRARKGMTASLLSKLQRSGASSLPISILTEGLYGGHKATLLPLKTADTILCIAGGIGITSCMSYLQQYANESQSAESTSKASMGRASNFVLAWSAREEALIRHVSASLLPDATVGFPNKQIKYRFWCTGDNSSQDKGLEQCSDLQRGRMTVGEVVRSVAEKGRRVVVVACAPGAMSDEARAAVVGCLRDGMPVDLIEEAFAW